MYFLPTLCFIIPVYTPCAHIPSRALSILIIRMYQIGNGEEHRTSSIYYQLKIHSIFFTENLGSLYVCQTNSILSIDGEWAFAMTEPDRLDPHGRD